MLKGVINNVLVMVLVSVVNNVLCLLFGLKYCNKKVVFFENGCFIKSLIKY